MPGADAAEDSRVVPKNIVRVVLWMTGALLCFSAMAVSVRMLAATLGVMEILALRAGFGLMVLVTFAALRAELRATINCQHLRLHLFRNTVHVGSSYLWAMSLLLIPLAMTFALEFTTPAWTLLLAAPVLGERLTTSRIGAVVFGLLGVLVILRPGLAAFQPGSLLALMAAFGLAVTLIATKKLTRTDSTFAILFWMMLIQLPLTLIASEPLFLTKLNQEQIPAVIGIGASGVASHYCLANAFRAGDAGVVVPLDFMRIPLIAVIGWWLYGEPLDVFVFLGAGLIITGILWNLRSETGRTPRS
jgi:drug/metabolite transporter (DMT)-like permease